VVKQLQHRTWILGRVALMVWVTANIASCSGNSNTQSGKVYPLGGIPVNANEIGNRTQEKASFSSLDHISEPGTKLPVTNNDPQLGHGDALVTVVVFGDLTQKISRKTIADLRTLRELYNDSLLRIVWKHRPVERSELQTNAALASIDVHTLGGSKAFWEFLNQFDQMPAPGSSPGLLAYVEKTEVRVSDFKKRLSDSSIAAKLQKDITLADTLKVSQTPAVFVNGHELATLPHEDGWRAWIDKELTRGEQALASGIPARQLYAVLSDSTSTFGQAGIGTADGLRSTSQTRYRVPIGKSPIRGPNDALVTIVEFGDFQCPYCKQAMPTLEAMFKKYGTKIRLVWKNSPLSFHTYAEPAAELALEAYLKKGTKVFWQMHALLFANQPKFSTKELMKLGQQVGLNPADVETVLKDHTHQKKIKKDLALADRLQAQGTPHFFINGRRLSGTNAPEAFSQIIDEEIALARQMLNRGVKAVDIYQEIQHHALRAHRD
jgi:protein-disulfide isomerase